MSKTFNIYHLNAHIKITMAIKWGIQMIVHLK